MNTGETDSLLDFAWAPASLYAVPTPRLWLLPMLYKSLPVMPFVQQTLLGNFPVSSSPSAPHRACARQASVSRS
ncbi:MAG: hypothetical protein Q8Q02_05235, partial [Nocardioides sp.]|nr:hypothetical protein [Nocardioides sp.]